jgi:hypothetical protein
MDTTAETTAQNVIPPQEPPFGQGISDAWGVNLQAAVCERCDWNFLLPAGGAPPRCPHCFQGPLSLMPVGSEQLPYLKPPELVLPFSVTSDTLAQSIQEFAGHIPFAPSDLEPQKLRNRINRLYLPMWLVDAEAEASWKAEAGFDYQVVSHQDHYDENRGGWNSRQVKEDRIRWEPRLGRLKRSYQNVPAPALEADRAIKASLGDFDLSASGPYKPPVSFTSEVLKGAFLRLPDRTPQDAWPEAQPALQAAAANEVRQAASAAHLRQFTWQAQFADQNWTLMLLPILTSYYLDDEQKPQAVAIHGQSGKLVGNRRSSMKRARRTAFGLLGGGVAVFLISVLLWAISFLMPLLFVIGVIGMLAAIVLAAGAIIPPLMSWWFNRSQDNQHS